MLKRLFVFVALLTCAVVAQEAAPAPAATPAPEVAPAPAPTPEVAPAPAPDENASTISVFVKNPEDIRALKDELKNLQTMVGDSNPEIAALLKKANRVAEMNDRCASISLNDLLDTTCARFYEVELPAFENEYMEVTGEVRLGSMRVATTLEERTRQLATCSDALTSIVISRDQLLRLRGNVYLEPINFEGDFDAEYNFELSYDPARVNQQLRLANLWIEKCGPIVIRQSGTEFAPMFVATLKVKNDSLKKLGSNVKIMMNQSKLSLRVDMRRPVGGAYYLNGVKLFQKTLDSDKSQSHLFFDVKNKKAVLNQPEDAVIEKFHGKEVFKKLKKMEMVGRWAWDSEKLAEVVSQTPSQDESEVMTAADSLAYKQGLAELERANAAESGEKLIEDEMDEAREAAAAVAAQATAKDAPTSDKKKGGIRWIPLIVSGAVLVAGSAIAVMFDHKAKDEKTMFDDELADGYDGGFDDHDKAAGDYQRNRAIGLGVAVLGGIGIALSIIF
jgi:hypothetical protein